MGNFERLTAFMDTLERDYRIRGASCRVIHHGETVYRNMVGVMDEKGEKPVAEDTLFRMYSMTKPVTVVAALQLFEQGKYLMTDPVGQYMPAFWDMKVAKLKDSGAYGWWNPPAARVMQVRDLFTMTAGLTYGGCNHPAEIATSAAYDRLAQETNQSYTTRQFADMLAGTPLMFEPGTHWNYSYCLDLLGALVEVWSGQRFGAYLEEHIFRPLGMQDTCFRLPQEKKARLSSFWEWRDGTRDYRVYGEEEVPMYQGKCFESGGAGLISSMEDYCRFAQMLCNLGTGANQARILSPATVNLMRRNHLNDAQRRDMDWTQLAGYGYGLGVRTMMDPAAGGSPSHIGEFGWSGMAGTYLLVDPEEELVIVYMQQLYPNREEQVHPRLRNIVYGCIDGFRQKK